MNNTFLSSLVLQPKPIMDIPTIFSFKMGPISISTYPLMISMGAMGMLVCTWKRRERFQLTQWQCVFFSLLLTICGIAGAKLLFILENLRDALENGISGGGVSFFGSVYLIPLVMPLIGRLFGITASQTNDLCAPCVAIMIAFIRIGCLLNGCCGGWVMYVGNYYFAWPTQIMECIGDLIIFHLLLSMEKNNKENILYPAFMLFYSIMRFFIEFLRYSSDKRLYLSNGHWFAIIAIIIAMLWLSIHKRHSATVKKNR